MVRHLETRGRAALPVVRHLSRVPVRSYVVPLEESAGTTLMVVLAALAGQALPWEATLTPTMAVTEERMVAVEAGPGQGKDRGPRPGHGVHLPAPSTQVAVGQAVPVENHQALPEVQ